MIRNPVGSIYGSLSAATAACALACPWPANALGTLSPGLQFGGPELAARPAAAAGQWSVTPGLQLGEIYTDNVGLQPAESATPDFITELDPTVSVRGLGPSYQFLLDYTMQNLLFANSGGANTTNNQLAMSGNAQLVPNLFFIDATSNIGQAVISPSGTLSLNNFTTAGNRGDVSSIGVSPYLARDFGSFASGELRYSYDWAKFPQTSGTTGTPVTENATRTNGYLFSLASGPRFGRLGWNVGYDWVDSAGGTGGDQHLQRLLSDLGYLVTPHIGPYARVGFIKTTFPGSTDQDNGPTWCLGGLWNPSPLTSLAGCYGKAPFGDNIYGAFSHQFRHASWQLSYTNSLSNGAVDIANRLPFTLNPLTGELTSNIAKSSIGTANFLTPSSGIFVNRLAQGTFQYASGRSNYNLSLVYEKQEPVQSGAQAQTTSGIAATWLWQWSPRTDAGIEGGWQRVEAGSPSTSSDLWYVGLRVSRQLTKASTALVSYTYAEQASDVAENNYRQNTVMLQLNLSY